MNTSVLFFVIESLSVPCFYPGIAIVFVLYFSHLPISSVGCSFFKNLGMARVARLLVTVGRGGVRSVRSNNKVTYDNQRKMKVLSFGDKVVYHVTVKRE